jgi:hypothetical protein
MLVLAVWSYGRRYGIGWYGCVEEVLDFVTLDSMLPASIRMPEYAAKSAYAQVDQPRLVMIECVQDQHLKTGMLKYEVDSTTRTDGTKYTLINPYDSLSTASEVWTLQRITLAAAAGAVILILIVALAYHVSHRSSQLSDRDQVQPLKWRPGRSRRPRARRTRSLALVAGPSLADTCDSVSSECAHEPASVCSVSFITCSFRQLPVVALSPVSGSGASRCLLPPRGKHVCVLC